MNTNEVIAVIGGWNEAGEDFTSLRIFDSISKAESYSKELTSENTNYEYYDYSKMEIRSITQVTFN
jgi:hypothetical protein